jgi:hypothetical protein
VWCYPVPVASFHWLTMSSTLRTSSEQANAYLEKMNPEVGSIHSQTLGLHGEVNGLQERVGR